MNDSRRRLSWVARGMALAACTLALSAQAGVVVGTRGNVPFGASSEWKSVGTARSIEFNESWTEAGPPETLRKTVFQRDDGGLVTIDHTARSFVSAGGQITLSAAASLEAEVRAGTALRTRGYSTATMNDILFVQSTGGSALSGYISMQWRNEGTQRLDFETLDPLFPLGLRQGIYAASLSYAETFVNWKDPATQVVSGSSAGDTYKLGVVHGNTQPTDAQWQGTDLLEASDAVVGDLYWTLTQFTDTSTNTVNENAGFTQLIPMIAGIPVEVMLGLTAAYNVIGDTIDHIGFTANAYSQFDHTAELVSVRFFNPDGTPYVGQWELVSASGMDYPEFITTANAVPLPGTLALAFAGLWLVRLRTPAARR